MRFIDLFAGLGGFHSALASLGHECVFASEIDPDLRNLYEQNFPSMVGRTFGDIRLSETKRAISAHDILCAGFPCQPFSKSGSQKGLSDLTQGTLFHEIINILKKHTPEFLILENVGNFERHDNGRTWRIVKESLEILGYNIKGTEHVTTGGDGLLSPHHLGHPHTRERFYIVGRLHVALPERVFPDIDRFRVTRLEDIVQTPDQLTLHDMKETALTAIQRKCITHWNTLLHTIPDSVDLPSFPIWTDELDAKYPYEDQTPFTMTTRALKRLLSCHSDFSYDMTHDQLLQLLPSYARSREPLFPEWKIQFIRQNREWLLENKRYFSREWVSNLRNYPASLRKFEWNCNGEDREIWKHVLQFRPSGLRVKRYTSSPALVAMTSTQIPILGPEERFLTRVEGLRLQGFDDGHQLPNSRAAAFKALGNAVHVEVIREIGRRLLNENRLEQTLRQ
jgi:DNA (cytosine-5)-methyltransferase 1